MFDRAFFEQHFLDQAKGFARERKIASPVVEFLLDDGSLLYVRSLLQTRENWLCLQAHAEDGPRQIYLLYYSIKRITLHAQAPAAVKPRDVGFPLG
ncbi:MAG: hypothetical protein AABZ20_01470 [candidate division NC10 bacterium]